MYTNIYLNAIVVYYNDVTELTRLQLWLGRVRRQYLRLLFERSVVIASLVPHSPNSLRRCSNTATTSHKINLKHDTPLYRILLTDK